MSQQQRHGSRSSTRSAFDQAQAQEMIRSLRVAELQQLLQELGLSKVGRKAELIERAIGTVTGKKMTTAQFQRLQQLHETRQGGGYGAALRSGPSASRSDMAADQVAGNSGYTSMPTLNNFFSTPSSILSPKNQLLPRFSESAAGASSSSWNGKEWAPAPALPAVPQMEELSSIRFPSLPFFDEVCSFCQTMIPKLTSGTNVSDALPNSSHEPESHKSKFQCPLTGRSQKVSWALHVSFSLTDNLFCPQCDAGAEPDIHSDSRASKRLVHESKSAAGSNVSVGRRL